MQGVTFSVFILSGYVILTLFSMQREAEKSHNILVIMDNPGEKDHLIEQNIYNPSSQVVFQLK